MLNFYGKLVANLSSTLEQVHKLLMKDASWEWSTEQQQVFEKNKNRLQSSNFLVHYDPKKELVVSCDAPPMVWAVLAHVVKHGSEKPVAYASRTLSTTERNYGYLDKDALTVVFPVKKFHQFLFGRQFYKIYTDHKPLLGCLALNEPHL